MRKVSPSACRDVAQSGSALEWGSRGRRFKSFHPDQNLGLTVSTVSPFSVIVIFPTIAPRFVYLTMLLYECCLILTLKKEKSYMTSDDWSDEELRAAVDAYCDMLHKEKSGERFIKKAYYASLASRFSRTHKAFEYRMQNISYVRYIAGRKWLTGLKCRSKECC